MAHSGFGDDRTLVDKCHIPVTESRYPNRKMFRQIQCLPEAEHDI